MLNDVPFADGDVTLPAPVNNVTRIRFTSLLDESNEPGVSEILVY